MYMPHKVQEGGGGIHSHVDPMDRARAHPGPSIVTSSTRTAMFVPRQSQGYLAPPPRVTPRARDRVRRRRTS